MMPICRLRAALRASQSLAESLGRLAGTRPMPCQAAQSLVLLVSHHGQPWLVGPAGNMRSHLLLRGYATDGRGEWMATSSLEVWSWGRGDSGQLGHGGENPEFKPRRVDALAFPTSQVLTFNITTEQDKSQGRGSAPSRNDGQRRSSPPAGDPSPPSDLQRLVSASAGVGCGLFHSCYWLGGKLWLWGKGDGGRLGFGHELSLYSPAASDMLPRVSSAALGGLHSAAVTEDGDLFTWGYGGFGALGLGSFHRVVEPCRVKVGGEAQGEGEGGERVRRVAAGGAHTLALTEEGNVFSWGRDEGEGRLGLPDAAILSEEGCVNLPLPVHGLPEGQVTAVACGGFFSAALSSQGEVWTWGGNLNGELGIGLSRAATWRPQKVPGLTAAVRRISCGGYHMAAVDELGRIWTWGRGGSGQLGNNSLQTQLTPQLLPMELFPEGESLKFVKVACGGAWTAALTDDGSLWTWGKNAEGQLGLPSEPKIVPIPKEVHFEKGEYEVEFKHRVIDVGAGASHGLALVIVEVNKHSV